MTADVLQPVAAPVAASRRVPFPGDLGRAPLVPIALALTAGIVLDRYADIPRLFSFLATFAFLAAFVVTTLAKQFGLSLVYLWTAWAAVGAYYHHWRIEVTADDDIGRFAALEPRPVRLRGLVNREPVYRAAPPDDALRTSAAKDSTRFVVRATQIKEAIDWRSVSGLAMVSVQGPWRGLHVGDEAEIVGSLIEPPAPANPGEFDYASYLRDQGIRALVAVRKTEDGVVRIEEKWPATILGWLAVLRGWGNEVLERALPEDLQGLAKALLLGEGEAMTDQEWEKYLKTGVIHVLAISGQHLVVLGGFLWLALRLLRVRKRRGAWVVALFLLGYALLTGGRPPVMRSAWMALALCGGVFFRRPVLVANSFALAWIGVSAVNPTDIFNAGCLLSFLAVAVLVWGVRAWNESTESDPLEQLIEESRPLWLRSLRRLGKLLLWCYLVNAAVWLALTPLMASRYHLVSPIALLISPPMVVLSSVALLSGFLLLIAAPLAWPLSQGFAAIAASSLRACEALVGWGVDVPGAYWYVGDIPEWWLWVFYFGLLAALTVRTLRAQWWWTLSAGVGWLSVGLVWALIPRTGHELRCTFLAVGHGGCTVIEVPDGRVLLYDAGAITGPEVTRRHIAPFLWQRGIRRLDEVFLSHADLDHFNGIPALLDRFAIGQVTCTPSFGERATPAVRLTLLELRRRGVPVRVVKAGDRLRAGDLTLEVLHPPPDGPAGNENARSMVLQVQHEGNTLLLTGDLEGLGLERVLKLPPRRIDLLMAPHHGSRTANTPELATWAKPKMVVSCEGVPRWPRKPHPYTEAELFGTWPHGAVTVRSSPEGLAVETYRTQEKRVIPRASRRGEL